MSIGRDLKQMIESKRNQWIKEAEIGFCLLATREDVIFTNITYPTGLRMVKAEITGYHKVEVPLSTAKMLRAQGYKVLS